MEHGPNRKAVRARKLGVLLLVAALLAVPSGGRAESVEKPKLTAGDFWTYRTNTSFEAGFELEGLVTSVVASTEATTILGVAHDVFRVVVNGSGSVSGEVSGPYGTGSVTGTWIATGEELFEADQLKRVSSVLDLAVDGLFRGVAPFSVRATNTTLYRLIVDSWRFPLTVGSNGSVELVYDYTQDFFLFANQTHSTGSGNLTLEFLLGSVTTLDTPAGRFAAYPVQETWPDGAWDRAYFSPTVGNDVKTESYNATGALVSTTVLRSYRYQALEPARFLGLTSTDWGILVALVSGTAIVGFVLWRRSRRKRVLPPSLREPPM